MRAEETFGREQRRGQETRAERERGYGGKHIRKFLPPEGTPPDLIISVCGNAEKECPLFPGRVERWHWPFDDPFHAGGSDEQRLAEFRRVRDEIKAKIESGLIARE